MNNKLAYLCFYFDRKSTYKRLKHEIEDAAKEEQLLKQQQIDRELEIQQKKPPKPPKEKQKTKRKVSFNSIVQACASYLIRQSHKSVLFGQKWRMSAPGIAINYPKNIDPLVQNSTLLTLLKVHLRCAYQ